MQSFGHEFDYEAEYDRPSDVQEEVKRRKNYSRAKRSGAAKRRSRKSSTSKPGCGMSARRNHRWTW